MRTMTVLTLVAVLTTSRRQGVSLGMESGCLGGSRGSVMWELGPQALWGDWGDTETGGAGAVNRGARPSPGSTWRAVRMGTDKEPTPRVGVPDQVCSGQK